MSSPDGSYTDYDPARDDPTWGDPPTPPAGVPDQPPGTDVAVRPGGQPATRPDSSSVRDDNVFDFDEEVKPVVLRGRIAELAGIAQNTEMNEPSGKQVRNFRRAFWEAGRAMRPDRNLPDDPTDEQIDEMLAGRDWGENVGALEVDAFAILCGATPPSTKRPQPPDRPERPGEPKLAKNANEQQRKAHATRHRNAVAAWEQECEEQATAHRDKVAEWEGQWDGGIPTRAQLAALPYRGQAKFFGYVMGKFADPFGGSGASTG